ncbi:MAG TPA: sortase, partial [Anaerolineae bacterium]|nr:sortase [Anaerolineae bacterium]
AEWIMPTEDERITLVTCWPYTDNTNRLIVVAQPVENNGESISQSNAGNIVDQ